MPSPQIHFPYFQPLRVSIAWLNLHVPVAGIPRHIRHHVVGNEPHTALPDLRRQRPRVPTEGDAVALRSGEEDDRAEHRVLGRAVLPHISNRSRT